MEQSPPIQRLLDEHELISSALDAVEAVARRKSKEFEQAFFERAFEFLDTFAHKNHFDKEEAHFFPLLESRGAMRKDGPIDVWLEEHSDSGQRISTIREALKKTPGDSQACQAVRTEALTYVELARSHIAKEDIFYITSELRMTAEDKEKLWRDFQSVEQKVLPSDKRATYVALVNELRVEAGL